MSVLVADAVTMRRGDRTVLDTVSVRVEPGQVVGLLGPNGSGKSTLLKVMSGLLRPGSGSVRLDGAKIEDLPRSALAQRAGYLPQNARCDWPLAVRDVVALGRVPFVSSMASTSRQDREAVRQAMILTDCTALADRPVNTLSGGELTRTMIARVLAGEPELLLLDEPVTGLDPRHQLALMKLLRNLASGSVPRGVLVVLHDLALAARFCDRLHVLSDGREIASGQAAGVLTEETIARAFGVTVRTLSVQPCPVPIAWDIADAAPDAKPGAAAR